MLWFQEAHGKKTNLALDDFRIACFDHDRTASLWIWFPVDRLYLHSDELAILADEFERVDVPAAGATFFV